MSTLYIEEFDIVPIGVQAGQQPAIATQAVTFSGTAGTSAVLNAKTNLVAITADAVFSRRFTAGSDVAVTTDPRRPADTVEYFAVKPGTGLKISAVANS